MKKIIALLSLPLIFILISCSQKSNAKYLKSPLSSNESIGVIIDCPNDVKNVVLTKFLEKGFSVKAINASDLYTLDQVFDISDYNRLAYSNSDILSNQQIENNIYKMHIYQFELNKAEVLADLKNKWRVNYLIILDLKDWEDISWGRAVNLSTMDLVWVENYATRYSDNLEDVVAYMINSVTGK